MLKVFLVDDEIAIRENLRNSFPWEMHGFQLVGEAPDGEMALPMIHDLNPDILLTDIRMPFMDGLQLCAEVRRTMPWVNTIILSGYDDFSYARQAISLGVCEYLLKPITASELADVLRKTADNILSQRRERENAAAMRERFSSGNQFLRNKLLASLFNEDADPYEDDMLLSQMRGMGINLKANCYTVIDISFDAEGETRMNCVATLNDLAEGTNGAVFVCSAPKGARAIILGDSDADTEERAYSFARSAEKLPNLQPYHPLLTIGETVQDFHDLRKSMRSARHIRHIVKKDNDTGRTIIGAAEINDVPKWLGEQELSPLYERLQYAKAEDVEPILMGYVDTLDDTLAYGYLRVAALIAASRIIQEAGGNPQEILNVQYTNETLNDASEEGFNALVALVRQAITYRNEHGARYDDSPVSKARIFLSQNFTNPDLMLSDVADAVALSQSHFSTVFAQETGITFTQYLTGLRIGKAKELLEATDMRSSQIAFEVGYNDAHYFSYLFKKVTGITPGDYRRSKKN